MPNINNLPDPSAPIDAPFPAPPEPPAPPVPPEPPAPYESRFDSVEAAVTYAQNNGQGPITTAADGSMTNQYGERMVYDSTGNLAPAPIPQPLPGQPGPLPAPTPPGAAAPATPAEVPVVPPAIYESRFSNSAEAIAYAQTHGQGNLTVGADGSITNQFGQKMGYDSDGNLAPQSPPVMTTQQPSSPPNPNPALPQIVYESRFSNSAEAIAYAQTHGQGILTVSADGTITNQFGQKMGYDSDGNLAPQSPPIMTTQQPSLQPTPIPVTPTGHNASTAVVPLPEFGSPAYKALLLETGRTDLIGFSYGAHLAAKKDTALPNFDTYMNASSGAELLALLGKVDVNMLMASSSSSQVQQLVQKFAGDPAFASYLNTSTAAVMPAVNTPAYENLLRETGRASLDGFDLQGHIKAVTEAQQVMISTGFTAVMAQDNFKVGSSGNDVIKQSDDPTRFVLIAGDGDDQVLGGAGSDVLIGGAGNDTLVGGDGLDQVVSAASKDDIAVLRNADGTYSVTDSTGAEGADTIMGVERVHFADMSLALDIAPTNAAGGSALLLATVFGPDAVLNPTYVGLGLSLLDEGTSFDELCGLAINAVGLTEPADVVNLLYTNVVGIAPTPEQAAPVVALLNNGMSVGELTKIAAMLDLTAARIDLTGLSETGLEFIPQ